MLISAPWPVAVKSDNDAAQQFEQAKEIISGIRQVKTLLKIQKGSLGHSDSEFIDSQKDLITRLAKLASVEKSDNKHGIVIAGTSHDCWFVVDEATAKSLIDSLMSQKSDLETQVSRLKKRLGNKNYVEKAPAKLIKETSNGRPSFVSPYFSSLTVAVLLAAT